MVNIENLNFRYGKNVLFSNLRLNVKEGNIYGLLGKNGAGKSTLLKVISGMLYPEEGSCAVKNISSFKRLPSFLEDLYYLPEEFYLPPLKSSEYEIMFGGLYPNFDGEKFHEYLKEFEIDPHMDKRLSKFSLGQKKKYLLAFGLASGTSLLLLDEPTNGLDIPSKRQFRRLVSMAMSDNRTIIISTHQVKDVENLIDPVIILDDGQILFNESMEVINRNLRVTVEKEENPEALYSEEGLNGYTIVTRNETGEEGEIDLEILFNTIVASGSKIKNLISREV
ncbi:ATP-binding cassette domain-containing protein [Spirochaeta isovalerica]|uniref:ABC-2 type transport system ATP-binding protein n=1 Tax=Spirochaeta isovalerica TaxID=150 RepID=A0A841R1P5_9SPIO|nr:ABC transporter ATP-binding protein [Spirochaeta isovalerica]MBB6478924.1 ABC-2 type transport system ATP-binding protein [Spirochaeta isovalerica]